MFYAFLSFVLSNMLFLFLHLESSSFPKPLAPKEEAELFTAKHAGDTAAREKLISHNLRLVAHVIKKFYTKNGDTDELISIGTIGLIKAVDSFDNTKGARFATYAAKCIENEVLMCFRNQRKTKNTLYISDPIESDAEGNALTLNDIMADSRHIEEDFEHAEEQTYVKMLVKQQLSGRERQIIMLRFGLAGEAPLTQQQVADMLAISRSYVSRIEKKAVETLRAAVTKDEAR